MLSTTAISFAFDQPVWRMEIDQSADLLFFEIRDVDNKQVSFSAINLQSGRLLFNQLVMPERWLTGIEAAAYDVLLLHGFQSEVLPVHKGLIALHGRTGEVLWSNYNLSFEHTTAVGFTVADTRFQPKRTFVIDPKTGQIVDRESKQETESAIMYPQFLPAEQVSADLLPQQPYGNAVHYLAYNNFRIVSLHAFQEVRLSQFLYVFNNQYELLFEDVMNDGIQKMQPEAFICYKEKLIWLKNRSEVKVLNL